MLTELECKIADTKVREWKALERGDTRGANILAEMVKRLEKRAGNGGI